MSETIASAMLKRTLLFGDLTLPERLALASALRRRDVPAGTHIVRAGRPGHSFFLVVAGRVKVSLSRRGREVVLAELGPGDYLGELSVIDGQPRSADVIAIGQTELHELSQDAFFSLIDAHPGIARRLLVELCRRLREADRQIGDLATVDAAGRIVRALLRLGERDGRREGHDLVFAKAPRQQEVAALAGTTRATTSRLIRRLTQQGLLSFVGPALIVHDRPVTFADSLQASGRTDS